MQATSESVHPVFVIVGPPAVGKSTTSKALAARFPKSLHIPVDDVRTMVVSGLVLPSTHGDRTKEIAEAIDRLQAGGSTNGVQGIELAYFDWIPLNKPITAHQLSGQLRYDITTVERWLRAVP